MLVQEQKSAIVVLSLIVNYMSKRQPDKDCDICYKIICKQCGWVASEADVLKIQKSEITACPECGWMPA
jgi:hypothetical protein